MVKVAVAEFRAHMSKYLAYVSNGQVVVLTSHGATVAELRQPSDAKDRMKQRLDEIVSQSKVGDVESP